MRNPESDHVRVARKDRSLRGLACTRSGGYRRRISVLICATELKKHALRKAPERVAETRLSAARRVVSRQGSKGAKRGVGGVAPRPKSRCSSYGGHVWQPWDPVHETADLDASRRSHGILCMRPPSPGGLISLPAVSLTPLADYITADLPELAGREGRLSRPIRVKLSATWKFLPDLGGDTETPTRIGQVG